VVDRCRLAGVSFTVSFTGQRKDEGIVVDSLAQAMTRVNQLQPEQFPAAIWEVPTAVESHGPGGRLIRKYPTRP
jgi:hypothetical protein